MYSGNLNKGHCILNILMKDFFWNFTMDYRQIILIVNASIRSYVNLSEITISGSDSS